MMIQLKDVRITNLAKKQPCEATGQVHYVFGIQAEVDIEASKPTLTHFGYTEDDLESQSYLIHDILPYFSFSMTKEQFETAQATRFEGLVFEDYQSAVYSDVTELLVTTPLNSTDQEKILTSIQSYELKMA